MAEAEYPVEISLTDEASTILVEFTKSVDKMTTEFKVGSKAIELEDRISAALQVVLSSQTTMSKDADDRYVDPSPRWVVDQMLRKLLGSEYGQWISSLDIDYDNGQ